MAGNTFGQCFRVTTWGESHGEALGVVIDGCPAQIRLTEEDIQKELDRRRPGQSDLTTTRNEKDRVKILSGIFGAVTTGAPITLMISNIDVDSRPYEHLKDLFRPGHADYTWYAKYGIRDWRGGGRSSARETAARVAAGAAAKKILAQEGIRVIGYTLRIGSIVAEEIDLDEIEKNPLRCPDKMKIPQMEELVRWVRDQNDSIGGVVETVVQGTPAGLGEPIFDKLDADLAKALMSIPAVKGVEIGKGFEVAQMRGSKNNDPFYMEGVRVRNRTNNAGGILGGISTGEDIITRIAVKPTPSIGIEQQTVDTRGTSRTIKIEGRHDPCICPRIVPVAEAMVALVMVDHLLRQKISK